MFNTFKLCPTYFSRGGGIFKEGFDPLVMGLGTCSSVGMLKGYMVRERLGIPALSRSNHILASTPLFFSPYVCCILLHFFKPQPRTKTTQHFK